MVAAGIPVARFAEIEGSLESTFLSAWLASRRETAPERGASRRPSNRQQHAGMIRALLTHDGLAFGLRGLTRKELAAPQPRLRPMWL